MDGWGGAMLVGGPMGRGNRCSSHVIVWQYDNELSVKQGNARMKWTGEVGRSWLVGEGQQMLLNSCDCPNPTLGYNYTSLQVCETLLSDKM